MARVNGCSSVNVEFLAGPVLEIPLLGAADLGLRAALEEVKSRQNGDGGWAEMEWFRSNDADSMEQFDLVVSLLCAIGFLEQMGSDEMVFRLTEAGLSFLKGMGGDRSPC